jgi:four helix bundle protein
MPKLEIRNTKLVTTENHLELGEVRDFKDLLVWKLARELRILVYSLLKSLPVEERYALSSQLRRAAQSIGANIAEGFGRYSYQENIQFSRQARGSAYEVRDHLVTALDAGFITSQQCSDADELAQRVIQSLNGYIRATTQRLADSKRKTPK